MYRGVVFILIACGLLIQSAPHGHCHAGEQAAAHDLRAHIHINSTIPQEARPHRHGPSGHHHHVDRGDHRQIVAPASRPGPMPNHDNDALYFVSDLLSEASHGMANANVGGAPGPNLTASTDASLVEGLDARQELRLHPPPLQSTSNCPLYVRHLALLL